MKLIITITKITFSEYLAYRMNFILWRFRNFLYLFFYYNFWTAVYTYQKQVGNYNKQEIFFYFIMSFVITDIVFSSKLFKLASYINSGVLNQYLLYPVSVFKLMTVEEVVDKTFNTFFSLIEILLFIYLFKIEVFLKIDFYYIAVFILSLFCALVLYYFISLCISLLGFWTNSVWAPRFLTFILINSLSGSFFPLDILPKSVFELINALPFSVLVYLPIQILQGKVSLDFALVKISIAFVWVILFFFLSLFMWKKGLKSYTALGV
ncbi:MAG: hypothetical protein KatS3mg090_0896 [Patescibacteria group bacterium]|nr:MAG: hypothetical protein KatS3mg090_0896 [Patescibacteria group bacterium]